MSRFYLSVVAISQASWESWEARYDIRITVAQKTAPMFAHLLMITLV